MKIDKTIYLKIVYIFLGLNWTISFAQVGVTTNTPSKSAVLDLTSKNKGLLLPRVSLTSTTDVSSVVNEGASGKPAQSLLLFNTNNSISGANADGTGFYYWDNDIWKKLVTQWEVKGQAWYNVATGIGATSNLDDVYIMGKTVIGAKVPGRIVPGTSNSGLAKLTVEGGDALINGITFGRGAGQEERSIAIGKEVMTSNESSAYNIAIGYQTLRKNTTGFNNLGLGINMGNITTGFDNTAIGNSVLQSLVGGGYNVALGNGALFKTTGNQNTGLGFEAFNNLVYGVQNTAVGCLALTHLESGNGNIAIGYKAGVWQAGGDNNIFIGNEILNIPQYNKESNRMNIGNTIFGKEVNIWHTILSGKIGICIRDPEERLDVNGRIKSTGTLIVSDARYKTNIATIENGLNTIKLLRGATYDFDKAKFPNKDLADGRQYGVIAQEVEKVLPALVSTGADGYKSVNYQGLIPVLIEAVKEQQLQLDDKDAKIMQLENRLVKLEKTIGRLMSK